MEELRSTVVDVDGERLGKMRQLYPETWEFVEADAWEWAQAAAREDLWFDAVSVDTFTGDAELRALEVRNLELWTDLARKVVTVTVTSARIGSYVVPEGWRSVLHVRAPGVFWLVLTRLP